MNRLRCRSMSMSLVPVRCERRLWHFGMHSSKVWNWRSFDVIRVIRWPA